APPSGSPRPPCSVTPPRPASCPTRASSCCDRRTAAGCSSTGTAPSRSWATSPRGRRRADRGGARPESTEPATHPHPERDSPTSRARLADTRSATRGHRGRDSRGRGVRLSSVTASGCHGVRATDRGWMSSRTVNAPTRATAARLDRVDAAKGISILLVVAHHVVWYMQHAGLAPAPVVMADEAFASLRMPLFFLASGLVAAGPLAAPWRVVLHKRVAFFLYLYAI